MSDTPTTVIEKSLHIDEFANSETLSNRCLRDEEEVMTICENIEYDGEEHLFIDQVCALTPKTKKVQRSCQKVPLETLL
ncbi:unnamed protein product [Caenorhabditis angaria]|uniref:Uncharacterized protein n=1 Tax=Caenorhabditis angaria TaxID=860376 RepID=A0A9P1N4U5_9PELO|nr:unnamed protein product [Caenorhabditis angaria]